MSALTAKLEKLELARVKEVGKPVGNPYSLSIRKTDVPKLDSISIFEEFKTYFPQPKRKSSRSAVRANPLRVSEADHPVGEESIRLLPGTWEKKVPPTLIPGRGIS
jgi:hypothetical protein